MPLEAVFFLSCCHYQINGGLYIQVNLIFKGLYMLKGSDAFN